MDKNKRDDVVLIGETKVPTACVSRLYSDRLTVRVAFRTTYTELIVTVTFFGENTIGHRLVKEEVILVFQVIKHMKVMGFRVLIFRGY